MKKAIFIGSTSGIGKTISEILIQNVYAVEVTARRIEMIKSLKEKNSDNIHDCRMDEQDVSTFESI